MTNQEAINHVMCGQILNDTKADKELRGLIRDALEMQIPKKPFRSGIFYDCPRCLDTVGHKTPRGRLIAEHHCKCGQSIDWSEE